jgi:hypothetical protein
VRCSRHRTRCQVLPEFIKKEFSVAEWDQVFNFSSLIRPPHQVARPKFCNGLVGLLAEFIK